MGFETDSSRNPRHPMRLVSRRTGLSPHVLRVWERRYGAVHPDRSEGRQRLYSDADILRLQLLHDATREGRNIGQLVPLPNEVLRELVAADREHRASASSAGSAPSGVEVAGSPGRVVARCLVAVDRLQPRVLDVELQRAAVLLPLPQLTDEVLVPLLREIGLRWAEGRLGPAHEHAASAIVRRLLADMLGNCEALPGALGIVVGTPAGQLHELGAMLAAVTAGALGWQVTYLGADLPAAEIARAAGIAAARVVALSIVYPTDDANLRREIASLVDSLAPGQQLVLGGACAADYARRQDRGVRVVEDLAALRQALAGAAGEGGL